MNSNLKYAPVFRGRQQEVAVLKSFDFGSSIYPCLEIIKEFLVKPKAPNPNKNANARKRSKCFEFEYLEIVAAIKAEKVFVDIPVHINRSGQKLPDTTIEFLSKVTSSHIKRTEFFNKLVYMAHKIIPVISSYAGISGEIGSIGEQEKQLRSNYKNLAFRCLSLNALRDLPEFFKVAKSGDYILIDWEETELDTEDYDQNEIIEILKSFPCAVIVHRNPFPLKLSMASLVHEELINSIDNSLLYKYKKFGGTCFSDFVGIKKDFSDGGGTISPGFIYYDAVDNDFYGFRYKYGGHKEGEVKPDISEFETTIVPSVLACASTIRMQKSPLDFICENNEGWNILNRIELGEAAGGESGKLAAKFKRISMEHYLHCVRTMIESGEFN